MAALGEMLRAVRRDKGLSLAAAERGTKIRRQYLEALEEGDYSLLPPRVHTLGFVRAYAAYLGLDPEEAALLFKLEWGRKESKGVQRVTRSRTPTFHLGPKALAVTLAGLVLLLLGYWLNQQYTAFRRSMAADTPSPSQPAPTATPTLPLSPLPAWEMPTATSTSLPRPEVTIEVKAVAPSWLRVTVDGRQDFEGILQPGTERRWVGRETIRIRAGNAGGIVVFYNGERQPPLGASGEVVEAQWAAEQPKPSVGPS